MDNKVLTKTKEPTVTFYGAAQTVTGSMHLVETAGRKILLDCGLFFGNRSELRERNKTFPFAPAELDAVILSHAHVDHCGNLPNLVRQGFSGPIYCTTATRDLLAVMLADAAKIQEHDAPIAPVLSSPLYTKTDTERTLDQCVSLPYGQTASLDGYGQLRLLDAGHLLGSAMVALRLQNAGQEYAITFTGDLGRQGLPFLHPPAPIPAADLLICESTYGGKVHQPVDELAENLALIVERTLNRGGKVLIPAFSLGRAQVAVHFLQKWISEGLLPRVPIYVDSPLVADIVEVYHRHPELLTEDSRAILQSQRTEGETFGVPFPNSGGLESGGRGSRRASNTGSAGASPSQIRTIPASVQYLRSWQESREVGESREPCVIVASGGMLDAGRALYHLQQYIDDPRCSIVLVSYQAPQSLGHRLMQRGPTVFFMGKTWNKWAEVHALSGFSGHADHEDFSRILKPIADQTKHVHLVHGEVEQAEALAQGMKAWGFPRVGIPERKQTVQLA